MISVLLLDHAVHVSMGAKLCRSNAPRADSSCAGMQCYGVESMSKITHGFGWPVTKNFVRLKIIILGQKISETFCPLLKFFVRSLYITINARGRELCLTVILTKMP